MPENHASQFKILALSYLLRNPLGIIKSSCSLIKQGCSKAYNKNYRPRTSGPCSKTISTGMPD
jgi:hypothetical protein